MPKKASESVRIRPNASVRPSESVYSRYTDSVRADAAVSFSDVPSTLSGLDERRAYLDAMDPLQAGGWKLVEGDDWRVGKLPAGDEALWAMIERADARFGIVEDLPRWLALKARLSND